VKLFKLGEVCKLVGGGTPSKANTDFYLGEIPWATVRDMRSRWLENTEHKINELAVRESSTNVIPAGNVVLASRVGLGKVVQLRRDTAINQDLRALVPREHSNIDSNYIYYWTLSISAQIVSAGKGATVQGVTLPFLENLEIPVPSIDKQREIVENLDSAFTEIDLLEELHLRRNKDLLSSLFDTYRDSLITSACSDSPLVEFGGIGNFVRGPFGGSLKKSIFKQSGIAVYEQQHAIYDTFESFRYFVDENKFQEMKRFEVKANDLIMSCSGTYGKIAVVPEGSPKGIINQALLKITPDKGVRSQFIKHWMQSSLFQVELAKDVGGAALQNVPSVARMKSIGIRLPDEAIQIKTIEKLDDVKAEIELVTEIQESIKRNYISLRQSILSNAFTQEKVVA
jgi:type I restriction enzyme S subunit